MHDSGVGSRLKAQLTKFSLQLTEGLHRPLQKFVSQMLFGIQASQDEKLGNIVRIPMKAITDSDLIPVTCSDVIPIILGAKRRWRTYGA